MAQETTTDSDHAEDPSREDSAQASRGKRGSQETTQVRRTIRGLATLFLLYHCAAITMANLPKRTVFGPNVHAPFQHYLDFTYQWQIWNMFTERPLLLSIEPKVIAKWAGGRTEETGPILPGLRPYQGELKLYAFIARVLPGSDNYRDSREYGQALCRAVAEKFGSKPQTVQLMADTMALRTPNQVSKSGELASPREQRGRLRKCQ
jgi:hypothetical protein